MFLKFLILIFATSSFAQIHLNRSNLFQVCNNECSNDTELIDLFNKSIVSIDPTTFQGLNNLRTLDNNKMLALHHICKCKVERANIVQKVLEKSTGKFKLYLKYGNFSKYFINLRQKTND